MVSREVLKGGKYCQYIKEFTLGRYTIVSSILDVIKQGIKLLAQRKLGKCLNTAYFLENCARDIL